MTAKFVLSPSLIEQDPFTMMLKAFVLAAAVSTLFATSVLAEDMKVMETDTAQVYGQHLSALFEKQKDQQVKVEPAPADACGLVLGREGIVAVPCKQLDEQELQKAVESEAGAPLAYLFLSPRFNPLESGKKMDAKKLRSVEYDADGEKKQATALILAVRHVEGDDWRLYVYGADKKPLFDTKFFEADDESDKKLDIRVQDAKDGRGTLVVTVLKKYEASIEIGQ
jgi:hypothetical protein